MATSELATVVIPPFIKLDQALWFHMLEVTFVSLKPLKESKTKYNCILSWEEVHLPPEKATVVSDVTIQPDSTDPHAELKKNK
ncbi:uncharacterized protein NPIL_459901 [Nephila pilipes]|uniref:DUF7041 domain-containing protein n=1 Tax=Nephila pilipes TaxID=299642 RepID=A0A8X6MH03_NEPPI|nr:uncharacterized protein NPIL_459901 [Nephila pilipes]